MLQKTGALTPSTKVLMWGQPYEQQYLTMLGIAPNQVVKYDPEAVYCAETLLVPTPIPRVTPPKEGLLAVRQALKIQTLPEVRRVPVRVLVRLSDLLSCGCSVMVLQEQRNTIVYVSRANEPTRAVANEAELLRSIKVCRLPWFCRVFHGMPKLVLCGCRQLSPVCRS
jgi:capsular polysaccharide biosynthesis protein